MPKVAQVNRDAAQSTVRRPGRPPGGPDGRRIADMAPLCVRAPFEVHATLLAVRMTMGVANWRTLQVALRVYVAQLPDRDRAAIEARIGIEEAKREPREVTPGKPGK